MDFTVRPPEGFELGHTQEYYEGRVPQFFLTDEVWGKNFRGGVVEKFGELAVVSGEFKGDIVTALSIGVSEDSTLCGVPLAQPLDRVALQLEGEGFAVDGWEQIDDDATILHLSSEAGKIQVTAAYGKPMALVWKMGDQDAKQSRTVTEVPDCEPLARFLVESGWERESETSFLLEGPSLASRLVLEPSHLLRDPEGESVVAHVSVLDPALRTASNDGVVYRGAAESLFNAALIGKAANAMTTAIRLEREGAPDTERFAQLHADVASFTSGVDAPWIAQCISAAERCDSAHGEEDTRNLAASLRSMGEDSLAAEVEQDAARYRSERRDVVPARTIAVFVPSDRAGSDTIFSIVEASSAGSATDQRIADCMEACMRIDGLSTPRICNPRVFTVDVAWSRSVPEELIEAAARDGLGVCNLTTGEFYLAGDEDPRFTSEITHRLPWASPTIAVRALELIRRESVIAGTDADTAVFLRDDANGDALTVEYDLLSGSYQVDHRVTSEKSAPPARSSCDYDNAAQMVEAFLARHESVRS